MAAGLRGWGRLRGIALGLEGRRRVRRDLGLLRHLEVRLDLELVRGLVRGLLRRLLRLRLLNSRSSDRPQIWRIGAVWGFKMFAKRKKPR